MNIIGIKFRNTKKTYFFDPGQFEIRQGDYVIVETARGIEYGEAVSDIKDLPQEEIPQPLKKVLRVATREDQEIARANFAKEEDAFRICQQKIAKHGLDMKLIDVEFAYDGSKVTFCFTADGRVDFRELVKDLATQFKTRIELRQIAVRDETKMMGGLGPCGNEICCKRFLNDFASVSIKMAKEQNLSLNPSKISGLCGRLICCLNFEKPFYDDMNEKLPTIDETVLSPKGETQVVATYPLKESVRVKYTNPDGSTDTCIYRLDEITRTEPRKKHKPHKDNAQGEALPQPENPEKQEKTDKPENPERPERPEKPNKQDRPDRQDRPDKQSRHNRQDRRPRHDRQEKQGSRENQREPQPQRENQDNRENREPLPPKENQDQ